MNTPTPEAVEAAKDAKEIRALLKELVNGPDEVVIGFTENLAKHLQNCKEKNSEITRLKSELEAATRKERDRCAQICEESIKSFREKYMLYPQAGSEWKIRVGTADFLRDAILTPADPGERGERK